MTASCSLPDCPDLSLHSHSAGPALNTPSSRASPASCPQQSKPPPLHRRQWGPPKGAPRACPCLTCSPCSKQQGALAKMGVGPLSLAAASFRVESTVFSISLSAQCPVSGSASPGLPSTPQHSPRPPDAPGLPENLGLALPPPSRSPSPPLQPALLPLKVCWPLTSLITCVVTFPRGDLGSTRSGFVCCVPGGLDQGLTGSRGLGGGGPRPQGPPTAACLPVAKCSVRLSQADPNSWRLRPWGGPVVGGAESWAPTRITNSEEPLTAQAWGPCQEQPALFGGSPPAAGA